MSDIDAGGKGGAAPTDSDVNAGSPDQPAKPSGASGGEGGKVDEASDSAKPATVGGGCDCAVAHHESTRLGWLAPLAWLPRRRRKPTQRLARAQRPSA